MYKIFNNSCYFVEVNGDIDLSDPFINSYYNFLSKCGKKDSTIKKYINSIHKFWIYNIYFPPKEDEDIEDYLFTYRNSLANTGFKVEVSREPISKKPLILYNYEKVKDTSIEIIAIEEYYKFLLNKTLNKKIDILPLEHLNIYLHLVDYRKMSIKEKYSHGSGYGLKARGLTKALLKESLEYSLTIFSSLKKTNKVRVKLTPPIKSEVFPFEAFKKFINFVDNPRDKLLYLFCGATSARISQALWLTIYDIDTKNRKVYLTDPRSQMRPADENGIVFMNQAPRFDLLRSHNIDPYKKPYDKIGFKYCIPQKNEVDRTLMFISKEYKDLFFELYYDWRKKGMNLDNIFIFQTKSSNGTGLLSYSNARDTFLNNLKKFDGFYPEYNILKLENVFHSLRHMWATFMADVAFVRNINLGNGTVYELPDGSKKTPLEIYESVISKKMGHSNLESTKRYFNPSREITKFTQLKIQEDLEYYLRIRETITQNLEHIEIGYR